MRSLPGLWFVLIALLTAATQGTPVPMTMAPADECGWIPAVEVEAIVGKLAGPPERKDGCRYTLTMPDSVRALREKERRAFEAVGGTKNGPIKNYRYDSANYAMTLSVDLGAGGEMKLANDAVARMFGREVPTAKATAGWDEQGGVPYAFSGRTGHVRITVQGEAPDVPDEPKARLAARVRDGIPDLPFPVTNRYQVPMEIPGNADPCALLTRAEAEAVLGRLLVAPYRSSSFYPPLAHPAGNACAYFTAGHHVFVLIPTWVGGAQSFVMDKVIGGVIAQVMRKDDPGMTGPWDRSEVTPNGTLGFLKADRLLQVNFLMSSTNRIGALKLATEAMRRLSAMTYTVKSASPEIHPSPGAGGTAPAWSRILRLADGRTLVTDGALIIDAAIARPASLPGNEAGSADIIQRYLSATPPDEVALGDLSRGPRTHTYMGPGGVLFNADYIDYLRSILPGRARIRMGGDSPAVIVLDGKAVGLIMPLR
jgi:hypothetical protein